MPGLPSLESGIWYLTSLSNVGLPAPSVHTHTHRCLRCCSCPETQQVPDLPPPPPTCRCKMNDHNTLARTCHQARGAVPTLKLMCGRWLTLAWAARYASHTQTGPCRAAPHRTQAQAGGTSRDHHFKILVAREKTQGIKTRTRIQFNFRCLTESTFPLRPLCIVFSPFLRFLPSPLQLLLIVISSPVIISLIIEGNGSTGACYEDTVPLPSSSPPPPFPSPPPPLPLPIPESTR